MIRESKAEFILPYPVENIWNIITDNVHYDWRSDVEKVEIIDETHFIEYPKKGKKTMFEITKKEKNSSYQFNITHAMFAGTWEGKLESLENGESTKFTLIERLNIFSPFIGWLSKWMMDLKKMQKKYISDLIIQLEKEKEAKNDE